jgi:carboxy-cis,cis-muconate cyclase
MFPVLFTLNSGTNSIFMYTVDRKSGNLTLLSNTQSPRENDAPRHVIISPDGGVLYSVTEHSGFPYVFIFFSEKIIAS